MREQVMEAIYRAIDEVNGQLPEEQRLIKAESTVLVGPTSRLNSLGVISFIVTTEQKVEEILGKSVTLTDGEALSIENSPFQNVGTLADYIALNLNLKIDI